ncbi:MAG: ribosome biogenesis GTPase Der [Bacteroidia bacterium]
MRRAALVGRPNVGKSSLFNRLLRKRLAIVEDTPGVTRDRHYGVLHLEDKTLFLIDTGGFLGRGEGLEAQVAQQAQFALEEADLILWVVDAREGLTAADEEFGAWLRRYCPPEKPIWLLANKVDTPADSGKILEFYRLGVEPVYGVSAATGQGLAALRAALAAYAEVSPLPEGPYFALIGRPNVGKSSLLNALLQAPRAIVSPTPGTTRDALYVEAQWRGKPFYWIDTAGLRRKARIPDHSIERYAALRTLQALLTAHVVLLVVEATEACTAQDMALLRQAEKQGKGIVCLINKADLLPPAQQQAVKAYVQRKFLPLEPVHILAVSALTGQGLSEIPKAAFATYEAGGRTISTRQLNDTLLPILRAHPHPIVSNCQPSIRLIQQIGTYPPTFLLIARHPDKLRETYLQFVRRQIQRFFPFPGWWLRFQIRPE